MEPVINTSFFGTKRRTKQELTISVNVRESSHRQLDDEPRALYLTVFAKPILGSDTAAVCLDDLL